MVIIEIWPKTGETSACLKDGSEITTNLDILTHFKDCNAAGSSWNICADIRDNIGVEFRIIERDSKGKYENRLATDAEKQETCETIFFDSETDFSDMDDAEIYLIWDAAKEFDSLDESV